MKKYPVIILLFIISCTPAVKTLKIDREFVYDNYKNKNFYILPAVNKTGDEGFNESGIIIEGVLKDKIKTIRVINEQETCLKLGKTYSPEIINELIAGYKSNNVKYKDIIRLMSDGLSSGYVVVSEFDTFTTREYRTSKASSGKPGKEVTVNVESAVNGSLYIFGINEKRIVYHADHTAKLTSSSSYEEKGIARNILSDLLSSASASAFAYGPEDAAKLFYEEIIDNIPAKGDKIDKILKKDNHYELK